MKLKLLAIACGLLCLSACSKEDTDIQNLELTLRWTGNSAVDGCGYILYAPAGQRSYKPVNESAIPNSYKTGERIDVLVKVINYNKTVTACMSGSTFNQVKILEIQRN